MAELEDTAEAMRVPFFRLGETGGPRIVFDGLVDMGVEAIAAEYEGAIPALLAG